MGRTVSQPAFSVQLVLVNTIESLGRRLLPGEDFPDWAAAVTEPGEVPATAQLSNWTEGHVMVTARTAISRNEPATGHAPLAIAVTVGALYEARVHQVDQAGDPRTDPGTAAPPIEEWSSGLVERVIKTGLVDCGPFLRQAIHYASVTVDPTHPLLINNFGTAPPLGEPQPTDP